MSRCWPYLERATLLPAAGTVASVRLDEFRMEFPESGQNELSAFRATTFPRVGARLACHDLTSIGLAFAMFPPIRKGLPMRIILPDLR
jgi:hypothetical protein